eukprot:TRINITY_DN365_c0_g1_i2.p1 TRINITY_DN365_c0_g1~~TRINITY_DN365_c0_g1_i2.p1  ORF type:complete len:257 (-),score=47.22 TRINITY_DN365_c0_g1_i2:21-791(-)
MTSSKKMEDEQNPDIVDNIRFVAEKVEKKAVKGVDGAFVLTNTMTKEECSEVKTWMFGDPDKVHHHKEPVFFRKWAEDREAEERKLGTRYITQSKAYADALWSRIKPFCPSTMTTEDSKTRITWSAEGLHERVRFVRYDGKYDQQFPPHLDGPWIRSDEEQSFFTVLFYLDESGLIFSDFRGGELYFYETPMNMAQSNGDLVEINHVVPCPGLCLIFPHKRMHMSKPVTSGFKTLIRSDIMYKVSAREPLVPSVTI